MENADATARQSAHRMQALATEPNTAEVAQDTALVDGLREAISRFEITDPDDDAIAILRYAAHLSPDEGAEPAISTTRLFAGAVEIGRDLPEGRSYAARLAQVLADDPSLRAKYENEVRRLFKKEPTDAALERLKSRWFSPNVENILRRAASERREMSVSDALVLALLKSPTGQIRLRMPTDDLANRMEAQRADGTVPKTLAAEVDAALNSLEIVAMEQARLCLIRAAHLRGTKEELGLHHILWAMEEMGGGTSGEAHKTNPSAMFWEALKMDGSAPQLDAQGARAEDGMKPLPKDPLSEPADSVNPLRPAGRPFGGSCTPVPARTAIASTMG
jgi:hypothetical protein